MKVVCEDKEIEFQRMGEQIHVFHTAIGKDFRGEPLPGNKTLMFSLTEEEASLLASSLRVLLGQEKVIEALVSAEEPQKE